MVVAGATGMLGHMVLRVLLADGGFEITATARAPLDGSQAGIRWLRLDAERASVAELVRGIDGAGCVVNCIGLIKQKIDENRPADVESAIAVNAVFSRRLAAAAEAAGSRVLQIATDCVYSGKKGRCVESDPHDAIDVYGKTKSLGESGSASVHHLRCSIIGPEPGGRASLLGWFLSQPKGAKLRGFTNHRWNGVTTYHFAKLCAGAIKGGLGLGNLLHVVPGDSASKYDLLKWFSEQWERPDLEIAPVAADPAVDRTLATEHAELNRRLWAAAGYQEPPTIEAMVEELAAYESAAIGR